MDQLDIQLAGIEDVEWSARLMVSADPWIRLGIPFEKCRKNCGDPEFNLFIARLANKRCAMILLDPRGVAGSPYIKSIAVDEGFRNRGIGTELIAFAEQLYREDHSYIFLCVSSFNNRARKLYERLGYRVMGEFDDYIVKGESEILMCRRLQ
jgi:ribosomal protein S18 acetylase RimI-like enzyme